MIIWHWMDLAWIIGIYINPIHRNENSQQSKNRKQIPQIDKGQL